MKSFPKSDIKQQWEWIKKNAPQPLGDRDEAMFVAGAVGAMAAFTSKFRELNPDGFKLLSKEEIGTIVMEISNKAKDMLKPIKQHVGLGDDDDESTAK